jgi:p90 ribosomal S6 kinase
MRFISYPSILGLLDTIPTPGGPALVVPFAEGHDLFTAMTKPGGIDEQFVKVAMYRVLKGPHFLHCQGHMHRDIKPKNIFLLEKDSVDSAVLADLGLLFNTIRHSLGHRVTSRPRCGWGRGTQRKSTSGRLA